MMSAQKPVLRKLLDGEMWITGPLVVAGLFWVRLLPLALIVGLCTWLLRWMIYRRFSRRTPADWGIVLLLLMTLAGWLLTGRPADTGLQVLRLLSGVVLYYAVANSVTTQARSAQLILGFTAAGVLLSFFALIGVQWAVDKVSIIPAALYDRLELLVADAANPNVLAGYLALLLPFPLAILLYEPRGAAGGRRPAAWYFALISAVIMGAILVLTQSRGAWMATGAAALLLASLRWKWGWVSIVIVLAAAFIAGSAIGFPALWETLLTSRNIASASDRADLWYRAIMVIRDFPFTGVGIGSFGEVVELFYPYRAASSAASMHAHSLPLQVAVDLGIPGLVGWLAAIVSLGVSSGKLYRYGRLRGSGPLAAIGAGYSGCLAAYMVHGLVDAVTWGTIQPAPLVWALWGGIAAGVSLTRTPPAPDY